MTTVDIRQVHPHLVATSELSHRQHLADVCCTGVTEWLLIVHHQVQIQARSPDICDNGLQQPVTQARGLDTCDSGLQQP